MKEEEILSFSICFSILIDIRYKLRPFERKGSLQEKGGPLLSD